MDLPEKKIYTAEDYRNLPEGKRAELINGRFYDMAPPNFTHQKLIMELAGSIRDYIKANRGDCEVIPGPFAVNLDAEETNWVEPDISIICDKSKITERGCKGAPDFIIEVVSPSSRKMDYSTKNALYSDSGVREYWIVDPMKEVTTVYRYEEDAAPAIIPFCQEITVGIYSGLSITVSDFFVGE
ncbi:MAG: Uma2 family endonuclease [Butyrivibrio sp.]|nr:Uma2 family endonuclease [Acetatifactor muris]MCM1559271.1 Uma2 family endonuclease [Butyrivibrio sp.]